MRFNPGFGFNRGEELGGHHLGGPLNHSLSHARDCAAYLKIALVGDHGSAVAFFKIEVARPFNKSGLTLSFNNYAVVLRRPHLLYADAARELALD